MVRSGQKYSSEFRDASEDSRHCSRNVVHSLFRAGMAARPMLVKRWFSKFGPLNVRSWHGCQTDKGSMTLEVAKALDNISYKLYFLKPRANICLFVKPNITKIICQMNMRAGTYD
jgi:hypothetical protein